jgi:hypothetical protein
MLLNNGWKGTFSLWGKTPDLSRICKQLRSPGIFSEESNPLAYVAWQAGTTTLFDV